MGVIGLTTFIDKHTLCLKNHDLHDTYVVIDGNAVASGLYNDGVLGYKCFGGQYDKFANYVSNFFDDLLKCHITPLIIMDGALEDKKLDTVYKRMKDRIDVASIIHPDRQSRTALFPLLYIEVFKYVVTKKNLKYVRTLFEADNDIACIAKILNCPVISNDSDFYIYDVHYIPYNSIYYGTTRIGDIFVKKCKMYKLDYILEQFPGIDRTAMPIIALLTGNDYLDSNVFAYFVDDIVKFNHKKIKYNKQQMRLYGIFRWLRYKTLETVVQKIINAAHVKERKLVGETIEMIIDAYCNLTPAMLIPLGLPFTLSNNLKDSPNCMNRIRNIINVKKKDALTVNLNLIYNDKLCPSFEECNIEVPKNVSDLYKIMPSWFVKEYSQGRLPSYFIDMLYHQQIMCIIQVEDFKEAPCINICLKIIQIIFNLLTSMIITNRPDTLQYTGRKKFTGIGTSTLDCKNTCLKDLPSLVELHNFPLERRRELLNQVLGFTDVFINQYPPEWKLYMGVMKYWSNEAEEQFRTKYHIYSLIFAMLFHIIDIKLGFLCRKRSTFDKLYGTFLRTYKLPQNRKIKESPINMHMSISDACINVCKEDCIIAMSFFISQFEYNKVFVKNTKMFRPSVVHAFSLFQCCLKYSLDLNNLFGLPYETTNVAQLFNGALVYNLYSKFEDYSDIDEYVSTILEKSPSLLQLFTSIVMTIKFLLSKEPYSPSNNKKKIERTKKDIKNFKLKNDNLSLIEKEDKEEKEEKESSQPCSQYNDKNNRFVVLSL